MARRLVATLLAAVAGLTACGGTAATPLAVGCTDQRALQTALRAAPGRVTLDDGTTLSQCIHDGTDDAELQDVGLAYSQTAEDLLEAATKGDAQAPVRLGFLIGAARSGSEGTQGILEELVRRIERVGGRLQLEQPRLAPDVARGLAAGEAHG